MNNYIFSRFHANYSKNKLKWLRSQKAYSGGAEYITEALIKHVSEVDLEFLERKTRAYYMNYPRKIARIITQYVLSQHPSREDADPDIVEDFSRSGLRVDEVMRQFSTYLNVYGSAWLLVDNPTFVGDVDMERKTTERIRPYCTALNPLSVVDWAYGRDGLLEWAIVEEYDVDYSDPYNEGTIILIRRLWTRTEWIAFKSDGGKTVIAAQAKHNLGMVPLVYYEETEGFGMEANHWFEDVVRISDAILNNESEAQMNIVKQMYGQLVISESFYRSAQTPPVEVTDEAENTQKFSHVLARSAAVFETNEENGITRYISPDGIASDKIRAENIALKKEMFDVVGLAVQKDSKTEQTAESKAWDNQNVQQYLATRADILEQSEVKVWKIMNKWDASISEPTISYPRDFSVLDLQESVNALLALDTVPAGDEYQREVARAAVELLGKIRKISNDNLKVINDEIDVMTTEIPLPDMGSSK